MSVTTASSTAVSVTEYSARIVRSLREVGAALVEGEVQKPKLHQSGMLFFDIADGRARLACKVFRNDVARLEHQPRHGDLVQVRIDRPNFWVEGGRLDVIVSEIRLAGEGELLRRREELLARLHAEGLCQPSRRPPLPKFPRAVGVIAAQGSEGLRDVVAALQDRFPPVHVVVCSAVVQGAKAPLDIIDALARLDAHPLVDVIVIARGGGSVQDLVAFDDERLCRAVSACPTPVVAAIGHTDNIPVCNHVAWASETPSRSPELAVPLAAGLRQDLELAVARMAPLASRLRSLSDAVEAVRLDAAGVLSARWLEVAQATSKLADAEHRFFAQRQAALAKAREVLASVPGRLPKAAEIEAVGRRLDTRAANFFTARAERVRAAGEFGPEVRAKLGERRERVHEAGGEFRGVRAELQRHAQAVAAAAPTMATVAAPLDARRRTTREQGQRLTAGIHKELADHLRDYPRALARHCAQIARVTAQRLAAEEVRVVEAGARIGKETQSSLQAAERSLLHVVALLAASDPRVRGWVLPKKVGQVVRSATELSMGDHLSLSFHDGVAGAVIDSTPNQEVS